MQKTFFSNLILLLLLNLIIKPVWVLVIEVNVQNVLGPEVYGNYFVLLNFAFLFMVFFDFGLNNYNNRAVSREPSKMPEYLATLGTLKLVLGLVVFFLLQLIAFAVDFSQTQRTLLWGVTAIIFLQSFLLFIRSNISGIQWYRADVLISVLDRTFAIVFLSLMLWAGIDGWSLTIERFVLAQIVAYVIGIVVAAGLLLWKTKKLTLNVDFKKSTEVLKSSLPYALLLLLMLVYYKVDAIMIERLLDDGKRQAGIYAQGFKLLEACLMFAYLFSTLLLPMFSKMIKNKEALAPLVRLASQLLIVPVTIGAIGAAMYRKDIMALLFEQGAQESALVFAPLILTLIPMSVSYIYGTLITAKGDMRTLNIIAFVGLLINVIGNLILIPQKGIFGAGMMTLITQTCVCVCQVLVAHRMFDLGMKKKQVLKVILLAFGLPVLSRTVVEFFTDWRIEFAVYILLALAFSALLGLFSFKKMKDLLVLKGSMDEVD
jgi:O-antigen/teichoic acid export membrane protein